MKFGLSNVVPITNAPSWSALKGKYGLPSSTGTIDYLSLLPNDSGEMGNNQVGDCFWAAQYHRRQAATKQLTGMMLTEPDNVILDAYCAATGAIRNADETVSNDNGTDPNVGFNWLLQNGLPTEAYKTIKLWAAIEIDKEKPADLLSALDNCIGLCVGIQVPQSIIDSLASSPPQVWDFDPATDRLTNEGHEIWIGRGNTDWSDIGFVSWGLKYAMTRRFWDSCVNQVTAVIYDDEFSNGRNPFNMTEAQVAAEMSPLYASAIP